MQNSHLPGTAGFSGGPPEAPQLLKALYETLQARLPASWRVEISPEVPLAGRHLDALLSIVGPNGIRTDLLVEIKRQLDPRDVPRLVDQFRRAAPLEGRLFIVSPFLGPRTRELLAEGNIGYADATGNFRLALDEPAVFIELAGAIANPWRERQAPLRSLKGPTSGRVVRALCDFRPPYGVGELAERSATPASSISRVVTLLDREALLIRGAFGEVLDVKWPDLIPRWTRDYGLTRSNRALTFLARRGGMP